MKVFAMLPCYNEEANIKELCEKWVAMVPELEKIGYELFVKCIDDKSTDNTKEEILKLQAKHPDRVELVEHVVNKGLGGVVATSFKLFNQLGEKGDVLILMDGDNTHEPVYSKSMIEKINNDKLDCVIASRYCDTSKTKGVSPIRLFMSWGAKQYYRLMLGVKNVLDYTCGYRAYTYDIIEKYLEEYKEDAIEHRSFVCMMEALYKLNCIGAKFGEVPFELRYDFKEGESKMRVFKTAKESIGAAVKMRLKYRK